MEEPTTDKNESTEKNIDSQPSKPELNTSSSDTADEQRLYIPASIADNLPSMVKNELAKLSAQKQEEFLEEYKRKSKSVGIAYLLLIVIFMHYGYLGKWGLQIVFWLTIGGGFVWWFIDLFRTAGIVTDYNKDTATDVMRNLKAMSN